MDFDAKKERERIVLWIRDWFEQNGPKATAVVGISGGKDSTIVAALLKEALGSERVLGVLMPNGVQKDIDDARNVVKSLGIPSMEVNIAWIVNAFHRELGSVLMENHVGLSDDTRINLPPRVRMTVLYGLAQSIPNGGRVANTCNRSEDYVGYSTKYGDSAGDFSPLASYTVREVLEIGKTFDEIPKELVCKVPSDGLCGQTDEEKFGFSYEALDDYILTGECKDEALKEKIDRMHRLGLHKLEKIPTCSKE